MDRLYPCPKPRPAGEINARPGTAPCLCGHRRPGVAPSPVKLPLGHRPSPLLMAKRAWSCCWLHRQTQELCLPPMLCRRNQTYCSSRRTCPTAQTGRGTYSYAVPDRLVLTFCFLTVAPKCVSLLPSIMAPLALCSSQVPRRVF